MRVSFRFFFFNQLRICRKKFGSSVFFFFFFANEKKSPKFWVSYQFFFNNLRQFLALFFFLVIFSPKIFSNFSGLLLIFCFFFSEKKCFRTERSRTRSLRAATQQRRENSRVAEISDRLLRCGGSWKCCARRWRRNFWSSGERINQSVTLFLLRLNYMFWVPFFVLFFFFFWKRKFFFP